MWKKKRTELKAEAFTVRASMENAVVSADHSSSSTKTRLLGFPLHRGAACLTDSLGHLWPVSVKGKITFCQKKRRKKILCLWTIQLIKSKVKTATVNGTVKFEHELYFLYSCDIRSKEKNKKEKNEKTVKLPIWMMKKINACSKIFF